MRQWKRRRRPLRTLRRRLGQAGPPGSLGPPGPRRPAPSTRPWKQGGEHVLDDRKLAVLRAIVEDHVS
ncbi:MAG TPA: hypothetical protein VE465_08005, partial [Streptosporangiaceae bacterium]|nr:hypothetical protein [Streptosporangiaceae bacterium]